MKSSEFAEILREKLKNQSADLSAKAGYSPFEELDPAHLSYLMGQIPATKFQSQKQYPRQKNRSTEKPQNPQPKPLTAPEHLSAEGQKAWLFFALQGENLGVHFSKLEVKQTFRRLAKRLHPDLNRGKTGHEPFLELQVAFKTLYWIGR